MSQYEHLPIYKAAFDLQIYFEGIVKNLSRYHNSGPLSETSVVVTESGQEKRFRFSRCSIRSGRGESVRKIENDPQRLIRQQTPAERICPGFTAPVSKKV